MKKFLRGHYLIVGIIAGVILGGIVGSFYPETGVRVGFLGKLFINALKMIVLPLILVSITLSIMKVERLGSLGLKTFVYFISTTALAVILGIVLVNLIHPGAAGAVLTGEIPEIIKGKENMSIVEVLLLEFVSPNLFESAVKFDVLPLIVASILFGAAFAALGRENKPVVELFTLLDKAVMKIVHWIMIFTPLGIFGLIAERIGLAGGGSQVIALAAELGKYFLCVVLGLFIHGCYRIARDTVSAFRKKPARVRPACGQSAAHRVLDGFFFGHAAL